MVAAALAALTIDASAQTPGAIGTWLTQDGDAHVQITECSGGLCGHIVWLKEPNDPASGKPMTDKNNVDAAKRSRPLVGVPILLGMRAEQPGRWSGQIYNADDGRIYNGSAMLLRPSELKVEGCVLAFCDAETWTPRVK